MLVQYKGDIGRASYGTVHRSGTYSSYWMDCIENIIDTRLFFE